METTDKIFQVRLKSSLESVESDVHFGNPSANITLENVEFLWHTIKGNR